MTFESLYIKSFGKLNGKKITFSDGVNIIEGANESGKSTICAFIQFIFYGLPSKTSEKMRYISWDTSLAAGSVVVRDKGIRYRIEREVVCITNDEGKYMFREKCGIYDAETNMVCFKSRSPGEVFFGVSSSVFESTVYIRQTANTKIGGATLGDEAENILFSGNERINTGQALSKLDSARVFLLHKNRKGGAIFDLEEKRNLIETRLKNAQTCETDIISLEGSLRMLTDKSEHTKKRIDEIQEELLEFERYSVKKAYLLRKAEKERLAQTEADILALQTPAEHANIRIADPAYVEMLESRQNELSLAVSRYNDAKKEVDEANEKIAHMGNKLSIFASLGAEDAQKRDMLVEEMERNQKKMSRCNFIGIIFGLIAVFSIVLALIFRSNPSFPELFKYLSVTGSLLSLTAAGYVIFMKKHDYAAEIETVCKQFDCEGYEDFKELVKASSEDEAYMLFLRGIRDEKNEKFTSVSDDLDAVSNRTVSILNKARFPISGTTEDSLRGAIEECLRIQANIQTLEYKVLEHKRNIEAIENDLAEYSKDYLKEAYCAEYDDEKMEAFDLLGKKTEQNTLSDALAIYINRMHQIEVELSALRAVSTDPTAIAEEIAILDDKIDTLTRKWSAYMLAIETLNTASGKLREGISPKLARNAGKLFSAMTNGKYDTVGIDTDFALSFSDGAMMHEAAYLSAGTGDLAYICLRMALIELLYKRSVPPFLFDESFSRMDDERMEKVLTLISRYAQKDYQSILFTCHSRERTAMQKIGAHQILSI
ncbi:MAG: AAA family ATPase [Clostridia bacterium]|nr:AAA family ATPase [Clostridia bacterium]